MKEMETTLKWHEIISGYGEEEAIVSHEPICCYLTDPKTGVVREKNHELAGKGIANRILVFPSRVLFEQVSTPTVIKGLDITYLNARACN